jgi:hypothetical protein
MAPKKNAADDMKAVVKEAGQVAGVAAGMSAGAALGAAAGPLGAAVGAVAGAVLCSGVGAEDADKGSRAGGTGQKK